MHQVLALTKEKKLMVQIESMINKHSPIQILVTSNNLDLIENYQKRHVPLIILDMELINGQVIQLINILRAINKSSQILLIFPKEKMSLCTQALSIGMVSYLIKPISVQNTCNIICSALNIQFLEDSN